MRDIEFRGRLIDGRIWAYGDLLQSSERDFFVVGGYPVEKETIGQYTGLKAAKSNRYITVDGKKEKDLRIFEGDIVGFTFFYYGETEIEEHKKGIIAFDDYSFMFISETERYYLSDLTFDSGSDIEIIGNIYDNPSFLEKAL
jgi:uncharacterized phage protein (TIGR01671 family)